MCSAHLWHPEFVEVQSGFNFRPPIVSSIEVRVAWRKVSGGFRPRCCTRSPQFPDSKTSTTFEGLTNCLDLLLQTSLRGRIDRFQGILETGLSKILGSRTRPPRKVG